MKTKKILFYLILVALGGCIPVMSIYPLYKEKDIVCNDKLPGTWIDNAEEPNSTWEFTRIEDSNSYKLIYSDKDDKKGSFTAHLLKLRDNLFLDIFPSDLYTEDPNKVDWEYNTLFLIPGHIFMNCDLSENQLLLKMTLDTSMNELLKEYPDAIEYTNIDDKIVLTSGTELLQTFILKYLDDERLFPDEIKLMRKADTIITP